MLSKDQIKKLFYNKESEEQSTISTINIVPQVADFFDNRCFLDTEIDERIEAVMFKKTESGICCEYVGTDLCGVAYINDSMIDEWQNNVYPEDTYNGYKIIYVLEKNDRFMHEISKPIYEYIKALAQKHIQDMNTNFQYIKSIKELILNKLNIK